MEPSNKQTDSEVKEVFRDEATTKFEWTVPNLYVHRKGTYVSPTVKYFGMIWRLAIDRFSDCSYVSLCRELAMSGILRYVRFTIGYKKADGSEGDIARNDIFPMSPADLLCRHIAFRDVRRKTSSHDLTFTCTLWVDDSPYEEVVSRVTQRADTSCAGGRIDEHHLKGASSPTQTEDASCSNCRINENHSKDISILLEHFKDLLLSGDDHDFLIKVKDKEFRAHKCVLRARSPVFAAMFRSKMTESADDSITIEDCDPDAFGEFLRYVYTGKVDISSASHALDLYYAGDKYDFPRLKETCVEFLKNSLTATRISDVINLAARHDEGELLQRALVYLASHLEEVMLTVEWQRFVTANPIQGNEMCIKALQCLKKG